MIKHDRSCEHVTEAKGDPVHYVSITGITTACVRMKRTIIQSVLIMSARQTRKVGCR